MSITTQLLDVASTASGPPAADSPTFLPERLPGESARWHSRACAYCLLGPSRSVDAVWRAEQNARATAKTLVVGADRRKGAQPARAPGSYYYQSKIFAWKRRASDFDSALLQKEAAEFAVLAQTERKRRRMVVMLFLARAKELLADPQALRAAPASVASALARALQTHMIEFPPQDGAAVMVDKHGMAVLPPSWGTAKITYELDEPLREEPDPYLDWSQVDPARLQPGGDNT